MFKYVMRASLKNQLEAIDLLSFAFLINAHIIADNKSLAALGKKALEEFFSVISLKNALHISLQNPEVDVVELKRLVSMQRLNFLID